SHSALVRWVDSAHAITWRNGMPSLLGSSTEHCHDTVTGVRPSNQGAGRRAGPAREAGDGRYAVEQRQQLSDVVAVAAGQRPGERRSVRVGQEVVLGARTAPIDRARARFGAPFFAWIWLESTIARDHSISPAARSRVSRTACN